MAFSQHSAYWVKWRLISKNGLWLVKQFFSSKFHLSMLNRVYTNCLHWSWRPNNILKARNGIWKYKITKKIANFLTGSYHNVFTKLWTHVLISKSLIFRRQNFAKMASSKNLNLIFQCHKSKISSDDCPAPLMHLNSL